jgi:hypothetical protein
MTKKHTSKSKSKSLSKNDKKWCQIARDSKTHYFRNIPFLKRSRNVCIIFIKKGGNLKYVPFPYRDTEICKIAVLKNYIENLPHVPLHIYTDNFYVFLLRNTQCLLENIPSIRRNRKIYTAAVKAHARSINDVPYENRTYEIWIIAVKSCVIECVQIPEKYKTLRFYLESESFHKVKCFEAVEYDQIGKKKITI